MAAVRPNPQTVEALLDTTWRIAASEDSRTDALDSKAAGLSGFAALVLSLTATLGSRIFTVSDPGGVRQATVALYVGGLLTLTLAIGLAVKALWPKERLALGMAYLERFPTWAEILKAPEQVRGETLQGLVRAIARERAVNKTKARAVRRAFAFLLGGLVLVAADASILAVEELSA